LRSPPQLLSSMGDPPWYSEWVTDSSARVTLLLDARTTSALSRLRVVDPHQRPDTRRVHHIAVQGQRRHDAGSARHVFVLHRHAGPDEALISVYAGERAILRRAPAGLAIAQVVWEVNRGVVEEARSRLLLHAAAAERRGNVVLLAGPEGSGKSTLVAALVCSGLRYVTDETVAVELPAGTIAPYRKPIAVDGDSLSSLRSLFPAVPAALDFGRRKCLLPAQMIRCGQGCAARLHRARYRSAIHVSTRARHRRAADRALRGRRLIGRAGVQLP
jgi:hypothetical protein